MLLEKMAALVLLAPLETEDQLGQWGPRDLKDLLVTQGRLGSRVQLEFLVRGVPQVKTEKWDQLGPQDLQAVLETEENKDHLE